MAFYPRQHDGQNGTGQHRSGVYGKQMLQLRKFYGSSIFQSQIPESCTFNLKRIARFMLAFVKQVIIVIISAVVNFYKFSNYHYHFII